MTPERALRDVCRNFCGSNGLHDDACIALRVALEGQCAGNPAHCTRHECCGGRASLETYKDLEVSSDEDRSGAA